jgi:hypothetical protein
MCSGCKCHEGTSTSKPRASKNAELRFFRSLMPFAPCEANPHQARQAPGLSVFRRSNELLLFCGPLGSRCSDLWLAKRSVRVANAGVEGAFGNSASSVRGRRSYNV